MSELTTVRDVTHLIAAGKLSEKRGEDKRLVLQGAYDVIEPQPKFATLAEAFPRCRLASGERDWCSSQSLKGLILIIKPYFTILCVMLLSSRKRSTEGAQNNLGHANQSCLCRKCVWLLYSLGQSRASRRRQMWVDSRSCSNPYRSCGSPNRREVYHSRSQ